MCGIVGATANRDITNVLIRGLQTMEYRGYDSAGIAIMHDAAIRVRKSAGKIHRLIKKMSSNPLRGSCGIGHTRWATHGLPDESNAHPHVSHGSIAVVHNGIIENNTELVQFLTSQCYHFNSDTDSETIAHLVHFYMSAGNDFSQATRRAILQLDGEYAVAVTCVHEPGKVIAARRGSPLLVGVGRDEFFVASDISALLPETQDFIFLEESDYAEITSDNCRIYDREGNRVKRVIQRIDKHSHVIDKTGYAHFMLKEIHEQPSSIQATLDAHSHWLDLKENNKKDKLSEKIKAAQQIHIVACGTSWHAACVAKYWLESIARVNCQVDIASEYLYRQPVVSGGTLFIAISQSGETADTLSALRHAKTLGYMGTLSICNVSTSTLAREADLSLLTHAGIEVGVASTKAFTTQLTVLAVLTMQLAGKHIKGQTRQTGLLKQLHQLPAAVQQVINQEKNIMELADELAGKSSVYFLGRGVHYPIALEGALKLKEISYIHAEAYAAGELKHGPLALIDEDTPVIATCPDNHLLEKLRSNLSEVQARGGQLYVFSEIANPLPGVTNCISIDDQYTGEFISPVVMTVALQLLAYHVARTLGTDIDQPRNLAKSVTVQ